MSIEKQLEQLDLSKVKLKNGRTIEQELKRHAGILADCIAECLYQVYNSYTPKVWKRDYSMYNSVCIDDWVEVRTTAKGQEISIGIYFDDGAFHRNFDGKLMNTALLINDGYQTHGSFSDVEYLGYREPTYYIEAAIHNYKSRVKKPFAIRYVKRKK